MACVRSRRRPPLAGQGVCTAAVGNRSAGAHATLASRRFASGQRAWCTTTAYHRTSNTAHGYEGRTGHSGCGDGCHVRIGTTGEHHPSQQRVLAFQSISTRACGTLRSAPICPQYTHLRCRWPLGGVGPGMCSGIVWQCVGSQPTHWHSNVSCIRVGGTPLAVEPKRGVPRVSVVGPTQRPLAHSMDCTESWQRSFGGQEASRGGVERP